jgi:DNA-binding SARP family transcriptional activator
VLAKSEFRVYQSPPEDYLQDMTMLLSGGRGSGGHVSEAALSTTPRASARSASLSLRLLEEFQLTGRGDLGLPLPATGERVLAFLALHEHPVRRCMVAGSLWPESSEAHSSGSLRSALWRVSCTARGAIETTGSLLKLSPSVAVDIRDLVTIARRLKDGELPENAASVIARFEEELLPDWHDDWIVVHREHWRQIRLHALETLAGMLRQAGDCSTAAEAGLAALRADPLRETAHRTLIETYLAEGNRSEALRQYHTYTTIMHDELGLQPSLMLATLVGLA